VLTRDLLMYKTRVNTREASLLVWTRVL
jgi:hypothetical protein